VLYAADRTKPGLVRLYKKVTDRVLYEGPIHPKYGVEVDVSLFSSTPARFRRLPLHYARELFARFVRGLDRSTHRRGSERAVESADD
jgi:hypothetical protein